MSTEKLLTLLNGHAQLLISLAASQRILERVLLSMIATSPDKSAFLERLEWYVERDIADDLYSSEMPEAAAIHETQRDRLMGLIRSMCSADIDGEHCLY